MPQPRTVQASAAHERFYFEALAALQVVIAKHPEIRNIEIIALFGRAAGTCIAMAFPHERDLARQTAIQNIDDRLIELNAPIPAEQDKPSG